MKPWQSLINEAAGQGIGWEKVAFPKDQWGGQDVCEQEYTLVDHQGKPGVVTSCSLCLKVPTRLSHDCLLLILQS